MTEYIIDKIDEKRKELGLNKTSLAEISGINRMSIHNIFSKKSKPTFEQIYKLLGAVNLKIVFIDAAVKTELPTDKLAKYIEHEQERLNILSDMQVTFNNLVTALNEEKEPKNKETK